MSSSDTVFTESEINDAGQTQNEDEKSKGKEKYRYNEKDDINILLEVLQEKPFGGNGTRKWNVIHSRLTIPVKNGAAIKRHFYLLMKYFKDENRRSLRASGTEEDHTEKMRLLQDVQDLMEGDALENNAEEVKETKKKKEDEEYRQAQEVRKAATETISKDEDGDDFDTPKRKRRKQDDFIGYLNQSEKRSHDNHLMTLELEKKRIELMEREIKIKEDNAAHEREMEKKRIELEEKRMEFEFQKSKTEAEEKALLFRLLQKNNSSN